MTRLYVDGWTAKHGVVNSYDPQFWEKADIEWFLGDGDLTTEFDLLHSWWCSSVRVRCGYGALVIIIETTLNTGESEHREHSRVTQESSHKVCANFYPDGEVTQQQIQEYLTAVFQGMEGSWRFTHTESEVALLAQHELTRVAILRKWDRVED